MVKREIIRRLDKGSCLSPQEIQDGIFARMSASQKLRLASDFSGFLLKLNQLNKKDGIYSAVGKNSQNFRRVKN